MNRLNQSILAILTLGILGFSSCKKNDSSSPEATDVDNTNLFTERIFNDVGSLTMKAFTGSGGSLKAGQTVKNTETGCMTISFDLISQPRTMTIDFGNTNCQGVDGVNRRGKIITSFSGTAGDSLNTLTTTFDNYFVNDNQVTGTRIMINKGRNQAGHKNWDVRVTNGAIIMANNGGTISYEASHNNEWTEGEETLAYTDDVYSITGTSSGVTLAGKAYSAAITTALIAKPDCPYFVSGITDIIPSGEAVRTLNYGNGDCDNVATLTVGGTTYNIVLPF